MSGTSAFPVSALGGNSWIVEIVLREGKQQHVGSSDLPVHIAHVTENFHLVQGFFPGQCHQAGSQGPLVLPWPMAHGKHETETSTCPGGDACRGQRLSRTAAGIVVTGE